MMPNVGCESREDIHELVDTCAVLRRRIDRRWGPAWSAWRSRRQDARSEWRTRLDKAIELVTSDSEAERQIGDELLSDLIASDLGNDSDRDLARRVAEIRVHQELSVTPLAVDAVETVGDTGDDEEDLP
ncbi:MAG: hypothetical protein ACRDO4_10715 [Nocardioides sp.]